MNQQPPLNRVTRYPAQLASVGRRMIGDSCGRAVSLPAVDMYAQSRRLQPELNASETASPPARVQKLRLLGLCLFSVIRHRDTVAESQA